MNRTTMCVAVGVALLCLGVGCADRPSPGLQDDPTDDPRPAPVVEEGAAYGLEQEGSAPEPADVEFEEDALPPPEEVDAEPVERPGVRELPVEPQRELPVAPSVSAPRDPEVELPLEPDPQASTRGFRVQLVAAGDRGEADRVAREAESRLGVKVYVVFEAPYHKIRAGDFTERAEALQLRERARSLGYDGAWVVATTIRLPSPEDAP